MQRTSRYFLGVFFFGAFLVGGLFAGYAVVTQLPLAMATADWPVTQGTIVKSELRNRKGRKRKGKATRHSLVYSYQVDGQYFDGKRVTFMERLFRASPETMAQRYPEDRPVTVHYAPNRPAISVLETGVWWIGFVTVALMALAFSAIGSVGLRATFR